MKIHLHLKPKQVAYGLAFAVEWAVAFAVAKRVALAFEDALADSDAEFAQAEIELRSRLTHLEHDHGRHWSPVDEDYRQWPGVPVGDRLGSSRVDHSREHTYTLD